MYVSAGLAQFPGLSHYLLRLQVKRCASEAISPWLVFYNNIYILLYVSYIHYFLIYVTDITSPSFSPTFPHVFPIPGLLRHLDLRGGLPSHGAARDHRHLLELLPEAASLRGSAVSVRTFGKKGAKKTTKTGRTRTVIIELI